jgi:DNA-directed RNA polymerase subunit RPC12/RpoP
MVNFKCANCDALYQVIKVKAGPETVDSEITCQICGRPFVGRDGRFVLKYFLLREAGRRRVYRKSGR